MRNIYWLVIALTGMMASRLLLAADPQPTTPARPMAEVADQTALEQQFEQTMNGATLVGYFTDTDQGKPGELHEERYTIDSVKKLQGDLWLFTANIKYGEHNATVPLPLSVKWAGDTPVITLTNLPVPGFGTFTARVLIYDGRYAGTWQGAQHGGNLFGRIERKKAEEK